ncbi:WD40 repeat domain-containing protein, partial [Streptomyces nigra]|uniref:WD40 repeat domain-containing protein n=1 Tax=Streptomyces nigra TaxID=1827580 RepID=UPI00382F3A35
VAAVACGELAGQPIAVSGDDSGEVRVWDLVTGAERTLLAGHGSRVAAVACGELAGQPIAVSGDDSGEVRVWDLVTGMQDAALPLPGPARALASGPNGELIIGCGCEILVLARSSEERG